jgi:hypothetical protein
MLHPGMSEILTLDADQSIAASVEYSYRIYLSHVRLEDRLLGSNILERPTERTQTGRKGAMFPSCELNMLGEEEGQDGLSSLYLGT